MQFVVTVRDDGGSEEGQQNGSHSSRSETKHSSGSTSSKKNRKGKEEFDISLPARHLVSR